jgi:hypothetical protein
MTRYRGHAIVALVAVAAIVLWPLTDALSSRDALQARLATAFIAVLACAALASWHALRGRAAVGVAVVSALIGVALLLKHFDARNTCIVEFEGRSLVIGTEYTPYTQGYLRDNPADSPLDILYATSGVPDAIWTADSIRACRLLVGWAGLAGIAFFAASAAVLIPRRYTVLTPARLQPVVSPGPKSTPVLYDGFLSYRHVEPDRTIAFELLEMLEGQGLRLAIDARDFSPNEHFLSEMERCIRQSRFTLCVVTAQYVLSEHTSEEAIISKTLDLAERRRRLVPLIYERVELPVWLHGLVGIDFTPGASVDPHERLAHLLTQLPAEP